MALRQAVQVLPPYIWKTKYPGLTFNYCSQTKVWEAVIGLEIHAKILAKSKLFSCSATEFTAPVNTQVSLFDAAFPGTLPVLNKRCVEAGVLTALALGCDINPCSRFDRKHYFYPDLPAGYQITQQRAPLAKGGRLEYVALFRSAKGKPEPVIREAKLTQLQLEQDSGKSMHDKEEGYSLIDLNRAGVGLMEIVTEPDFRSGEEAAGFVKELRRLLQLIGTCDGNMAEGSMRVDASVSIRRPGQPLGTRSEVKNINSQRFVAQAIDYEIIRQIEILEKGGQIVNETRNYDYITKKTFSMRDKEKVHDYRFMPEPNLPPLRLYTRQTLPSDVKPDQAICIDELESRLPELPAQMRERVIREYGITLLQYNTLQDKEFFDTFIRIAEPRKEDSVAVYQMLIEDYATWMFKNKVNPRKSPVTDSQLADLFELLHGGHITMCTWAKIISQIVAGYTESPKQLVESKQWSQITDHAILDRLCQGILDDNPSAVDEYLGGKEKVFAFFLRLAEQQSDGCADLQLVASIYKQKLLLLPSKTERSS